MIYQDAWLDPVEWRELGESEAHLYKEIARSCNISLHNRRNGRLIDTIYKQHLALYQAGELNMSCTVKGDPLQSWTHVRNVGPAHRANEQRGIRTSEAVKNAWYQICCPARPKPSTKDVCRCAARLLGNARHLSTRQTSRLISQLRKRGDIP